MFVMFDFIKVDNYHFVDLLYKYGIKTLFVANS